MLRVLSHAHTHFALAGHPCTLPPNTPTCKCSRVRTPSHPAHLGVYLHAPKQLYWNALGHTYDTTHKQTGPSKQVHMHSHARTHSCQHECIYIHSIHMPMRITTYCTNTCSHPTCATPVYPYTHTHAHTSARIPTKHILVYMHMHAHIHVYPRIYMTIHKCARTQAPTRTCL